MLDNRGFDLWADGYDLAVGLSDEENTYPFAGYKEILGSIFQTIMEKPGAVVLDVGFGTGTLTTKLFENGCTVYGIKAIFHKDWWKRCRAGAMTLLWPPTRCII